MITTSLFLIVLAVVNAIYINGLHRAFSFEVFRKDPTAEYAPGFPDVFDPDNSMIFGRVHYVFNKYIGATFCKPFFSCIACMASVHSVYIFWPVAAYMGIIAPITIAIFAIYMVVVSELSVLISNHSE